MSQITNQQLNWKTRAYLIGLVGGAVFGFLAAMLYARAAEEEAARSGGNPPSIPTTSLIGLLLSALALIRQIAETGKPRK
jgi:H+/Cl- antiporter ClcA